MKKIYYGWFVLLGLTTIYFASNGYGYLSIPTFYPSLSDFLKVPKGEVPKTASILTFTIAILSPLNGYLLDKFSAKKILIFGVIGIVFMQFYFSKIQNLNDLRIFNFGYAVMLSFGGFVTSVYILNKWFQKHRGIAMGIFLNASSLGAAFFSSKIGFQLKNGILWQNIALDMCIFTSILLILPLVFIKISPKSLMNNTEFEEKKTPNLVPHKNFITYLKTANFWLLIFVTGFLWFCLNSFLFHKDSILVDLHLLPNERGNFSQIFFISGVFGKLTFGFLSDKFDKKLMLKISILCLFLGICLLKFSYEELNLLPLVAITYGLGYSGVFTMIQILIAETYMGNNFGKILGVFIMTDTLFGAFGTYILGNLRNSVGNYFFGINLLLAICILAFSLTFFIKKSNLIQT